MNYRTIAVNLGKILLLSAFFYLFPILISLVYGEYAEILSFAAASLVSCAAGGVLWLFRKGAKKIRTKEGVVIVGLSWILVSAVGALPFFLNGCIPNYLDCLFETVSGFTTTAPPFSPISTFPAVCTIGGRSRIGWAAWGYSFSCLRFCPLRARGAFS